MKYIILIFAFTLAYTMFSCDAKNASSNEVVSVENPNVTNESSVKHRNYLDIIKTVYTNFVFAIDENSEVYTHPEQYFTSNALKKLKDSYGPDCEENNCYAFYELRTQEQDSKPGTTGESDIIKIESIGDDWFVVKYSDMGWLGMTRIKIVNGKIDDFKRCVEDL